MKHIAPAVMSLNHFGLGINLAKLEPKVADDSIERVGIGGIGTILFFPDGFSTPVARTEFTRVVLDPSNQKEIDLRLTTDNLDTQRGPFLNWIGLFVLGTDREC